MKSSIPAPSRHTRFAALVDIENVLISDGRLLDQSEASDLVQDLRGCLGPIPTRLATGPKVLGRHTAAVTAFGAGLTLVGTSPDAADAALVEAGRDFVAAGVTDLVIVSGDHAFTELASIARLHVVSHSHHLSRRLQLAASTLTLIPARRPATATAAAFRKAVI
ncbi:hypothetical protein IEQ44_15390 [Nocardioides sp. Y6]|uniref:NYN domain-containing protein n=1 Tax=Nocardioides malaquae TaxID=2773426 RepID=A0ABR9RWS0_9ACTN|nr:hypothetical protein [Nocardioides malaquae]MBE7326033.1 hypothetical protein [Nocardioides malaquae]